MDYLENYRKNVIEPLEELKQELTELTRKYEG